MKEILLEANMFVNLGILKCHLIPSLPNPHIVSAKQVLFV